MIGEKLTGLSESEEVSITLESDNSDVKTEFIIRNVPAGVDLEAGRVSALFEAGGLQGFEGLNYGWLAFGLVSARNWKKEGDTFEFPATEKVKLKTGRAVTRISIEWLIATFGYKAMEETRNELGNAIYRYNTLTPAERKNWTWSLKSNTLKDNEASPVSGQL